MTVLRRSLVPAALLAAAMVAFLGFFALSASAEAGVTETPRTDTLRVIDGEVLDSVVIGNRVIVVGTFTQVQNPGGNTISQAYVAAYNADTGRFDTTFRPDVDNFVNAIATDGSAVYIAGQFGNVGGESHRRIAKINANGSVNSNFTASMGSTPNTLDVANGRVYVGGGFTSVNNEPREAFAVVDSNSGALDAGANFDFSESTQNFGGITVRWIEVSPNGNFLFMSHSARFIDGENRSGIAKFNLTETSTRLANWRTPLYENELDEFTLRMRRLAISPDGSYVVQVTSGGDRPPSGDTAIRFPTAGGGNVQPVWISRHFDTVLGVDINDDVVFVGGHFQFQEAPGSDNPFPGDPDIRFGFGQNQGPQVLGDQVVQREQLGALDPATGKSLDWNPGSDSFIGVQSLTWDDELGLLVGHDGARLGGVNNIGRHAIFPIGNTPGGGGGGGGGGGDFSCTATFDGGSADVTFDGDLGTSLQLRRNGSWAATVTGNNVTINADAGDTITARLRGPNYADPFQDIDCTTDGNGGGGGGGGNPGEITTTIGAPPNGGVVTNESVTISGEATAPDGLDKVRLTVQRRNTGEYVDDEGNFVSDFAPLDVDVSGTSDSWSINVTLPFAGNYDVTARTFDSNGVRNETVRSSFLIGAVNNNPPELFTNNAILNDPFVNLSGSASDDLGIESVTLLIQNRETFEYLRRDGTIGAAQRHTATLSNPGGTFTNWSITVRDLDPALWSATIDANDTTGQRDRASVFWTINE